MEIVLAVISFVLLLSVILSIIRNDFWIFKISEYPRLQKLILIVFITICWFLFWPITNLFYQLLVGGLIISVIYLIYKIWPYTILSKKEMLQVASTDRNNELTIFSANVLQENTDYDRMLQQIRSVNADIVFLLETNIAWANAMQELKKEYPYSILAPQENTYGLLFYSRHKLEDEKIMYLVKTDLPSVDTKVVLPSGEKVQLWGLHPEPPVPGESIYSTAKDKELMKVALKAKDYKGPCIVCGDLNDVAWSYTTELFRKTSELLDPRRGRGFYSTFSAHHVLIRYPLDYIFCSRDFCLVAMKRLPKNGSDHFATFTHLALRKDLVKAQNPPKADQKEMEEAKELANHYV